MDDLLRHLIGHWTLRGKMGDASLHQAVVAKGALADLFVEMHFTAVHPGEDGNPAYEAIYLIGRDEKRDRYVLNLFDTAGVVTKPVPGVGIRDGNSIRFQFDYDSGPWFNTFTWLPKSRTWRSVITFQEAGQVRTFAEKELIPEPK